MDNSKLQTQIMYWAKNNSSPPTTLQSVSGIETGNIIRGETLILKPSVFWLCGESEQETRTK